MRKSLLTILAAFVSFVAFAQTEIGSNCANPSAITSLPFSAQGVSTIDTCHYNLSDYTMRSGNYVFAYTPTEDMAVNISISSISRTYTPAATTYTSYPNVGLFLYQGCPDSETPQLVGTPFVTSSALTTSGSISGANLIAGNEYFIVVAVDSLIVDPISILGFVISEGAASYTTATFNLSVARVVEHDIALQSVSAPESGCEESTTVSYTIVNNGELAVDADAVTVVCNVNGNDVASETLPEIASGASLNMTFADVALAEGNNTIILTATYGLDENNSDNTQSITAHRNNVIVSYPYTENFENATTEWLPSASGAWTILTDENENHYYKTDTAVSTNSNITGPCFSFAELEMPEIHFDIKANFPTLSGDISQIGSMFGLGDISFSVKSALLASTNGGSSWDTVANIDATTGWVNKNISLANYAGESSVMLRIYYNVGLSSIASLIGITTVGGEGVAIDNIIIKDAPQNDLGVTSITAPVSGCGLSDTHVAIVVKNYGRQAQSNYTVKFSLDDGATWTEETIATSIAPSETYNYTFNASTNLSTYGEYIILASTGDDEENSNNATEKSVVSQGLYTNAEVIFDDVYNTNPQYRIINDWYPAGTNSSWAFGKTANGSDSTWTWATNPNGPANDNETSFLYSPCYDLSNITNPIVKIYLKYNMSSIDMGDIEGEETPIDPSSMMGMFGGNLSLQYTLNGSAWITVTAGELNEGWYSANELMSEVSEPGWSGNSDGFISVKTSLSFPAGADLTNVKFRFSFKTSSMNMGGEEIPFDISNFMGGNINGAAIAQFIVYGCQVPVPSASFTYTNEPCTGTVVFTNTSENADSYAWNFGDGLGINLGDLTGETGFDIGSLFGDGGTTSTEENPTMNYTTNGTYNVVLTATNECGTSVATDSITIDLCTEIEENAANEISIYPNPANNVITIANAENANVEFVNALGQTVMTKNGISNNQSVDISNLVSGTYFIKINEKVIKVNIIR